MKILRVSKIGMIAVGLVFCFVLGIILISTNSPELFSARIALKVNEIRKNSLPTLTGPLQNDPIQAFINTAVPVNPVVEKIVFAVNKDFADQHSDWKDRATRVINDLNTGFSKTTKKQFEVGKFVTYEIKNGESPYIAIQKLVDDATSYTIPGVVNTCKIGRLLIYLVVPDEIAIENAGGGNNYFPGTGSVYGNAIIPERPTKSTLLKESMTYMDDLESTYWTALKTVAHELGHSLGLAVPDWYQYEYEDLIPEDPKLPPYSINQMYPMDPQTAAGGTSLVHYPDKIWEFSDLNAFIINHGLCKSLTTEQIRTAMPNTVIVRVKDDVGNIANDAKVDVYGINNQYRRYGDANPNYFVLKQSIQTNDSGSAIIKTPQELTLIPPVYGVFDTEIIKVSKNGKRGGAYLSTYDLQWTRFINNKTTHYLDIVIK